MTATRRTEGRRRNPPASLSQLLARNEHVRRPEQLETLLADLARTGLVERLPGGRWRLTDDARREFGWALALMEIVE